MWGWITKRFVSKPEDPFFALIAVAQQDAGIKGRLLQMLDQEPMQRHLTLRRWHDELQEQGAPGVFIAAVAFLLNDATADRALQLLTQP